MVRLPRSRTRPAPTVEPRSNEEAVAAEVMRTMGAVGIGQQYHNSRLHQYPRGEELKHVLLDTWPSTVREGNGITIIGDTQQAGDLHMMIARGVHLAGMTIRVMSLMELSATIQGVADDPDLVDADPLPNVGALFIRKFFEVGQCPLRKYETALIEELLDRRMSDGKAVFPWVLGFTEKLEDQWWSRYIRDRLDSRNTNFRV